MKPFCKVLFPVLTLLLSANFARGAEYDIDPNHSQVLFKIKHLGISTVTGRFTKFSGTFDVDPADLGKLQTKATIEVTSVDTGVADRDKHLLTPEFFDGAKHPQMTFVSKEVKAGPGNKLQIIGELTLHGTTQPVSLDAEFGGSTQDPRGNERAGLTATAKISRKVFGIPFDKTLPTGTPMVGDEVQITLEIEGIKKK